MRVCFLRDKNGLYKPFLSLKIPMEKCNETYF
ncbi:MAG: hypothetical protein ACI920_002500, partial [Saprospiraceae bacterium]